ncbi:MAG: redox-regulated ATPase YchF [Nanoarchaeota archaeon]
MLIGIVGKPSCGKSTMFKALTLADVAIASYPFTTIKPNEGIAYIKIDCVDKEFNVQCNPREGYCINHKRFVAVKMIDVAGLVPGAHEGKGLGLSFLDDLNQADVLIHVIDAAGATNEKGETVQAGTYDPANDIKFLEHELDYWYMNILKKGWDKLSRTALAEKQNIVKVIAKQMSGLKVTEDDVKQAVSKLPENFAHWKEEHMLILSSELRKMSKPMVIAANKADLPEAESNIARLKQQFPHLIIIPCSGDGELALREAAKKELIEYIPGESSFTIKGQPSEQHKKVLTVIQETILNKWHSTGVQQVLNTAVLDLLKYLAIFPGGMNKLSDQHGNVLPDCFLLPPNATALDFANHIHTDLGKNFVKALDVKTKKVIGKDHKLQHRDVIEIVTKK